MPNVDVIIPTHNCIFIAKAIESVIRQTHQNLHIIIIDDGSTDDAKDTVYRFRNLYPGKINYYYQHQQGPAAARNTGIKRSSNEYIAFLDADDIWLPEKLEKQLLIYKKNPDIGFVYCDNYFIDKSGNIIKDYIRKVKLVEGNILLDFFMDFFLITSAIIIKRSCIQKVGLFNENLQVGEDFEFFLRLAKYYTAGVVREKLLKRRVWARSLSKRDYELNTRIDIETLKKFISVHSAFNNMHRQLIMKRMSDMYFKFGYMYLEHKKNLKALTQFTLSLRFFLNIKAIKGLISSILPKILLSQLKKQNDNYSR